MRSCQLVVFLILLSVALAADAVTLTNGKAYSMAPAGTFSNLGRVSYVNTDDTQTKFVASAQNTLRFYPEVAGSYDNASAYDIVFNETIPQMRYCSDGSFLGSWLAARGGSSNLIYFLTQNFTNNAFGRYYLDHTVNLSSYPNSLGWAYDDSRRVPTLAVGLADGNISLLQYNAESRRFFNNQSIATNHTGGVAKVFGTTSRIYSAGGAATDNNINVYWLNTTTGKWTGNWTVPSVGTATDTVSAMHVSGNEKRVAVGQSSGDIYILGHPDDNYEWTIGKTIPAASAHGVFPINFVRVTSNGWHLLTAATNPFGQAALWTKNDDWGTPTGYNLKAQSGDWDNVNNQFTIGLYGDTTGAFVTGQLWATACDNGFNASDNTRCQCAAGQTWIQGGCKALTCTAAAGKNYNGFNTSDNSKSCLCNAGYKWDETALICIKNCDPNVTANSNGTNYEFLSCECNLGFQWNYNTSSCTYYQNCTGMGNSTGKNVNSDTCECNAGFVWNSSWTYPNSAFKGRCQLNCSNYARSTGVNTDPWSCGCAAGYYWNASWNNAEAPDHYGACQLDCANNISQWNTSQPEGVNPTSCTCNTGYNWVLTKCVVNCSTVVYGTGVVDGTVCKCASGYRWDTPTGQCVSSKSSNALAIGLGVGIPLGILALLGLAGLLWWCCRPAPIPMMPVPSVHSMAPMVAAPVVTSRVVSPVTTTQVVRPAVKTVVPQTMTSMTRLVPNGGFQPGVGGVTSYAVGGMDSGVTGFGTPIGGPSYVGQGLIGGTNGIPINRF
jgi:hypothetical protein